MKMKNSKGPNLKKRTTMDRNKQQSEKGADNVEIKMKVVEKIGKINGLNTKVKDLTKQLLDDHITENA